MAISPEQAIFYSQLVDEFAPSTIYLIILFPPVQTLKFVNQGHVEIQTVFLQVCPPQDLQKKLKTYFKRKLKLPSSQILCQQCTLSWQEDELLNSTVCLDAAEMPPQVPPAKATVTTTSSQEAATAWQAGRWERRADSEH